LTAARLRGPSAVGVAGEVCACAAPLRGEAGRLSRVATVYLVR